MGGDGGGEEPREQRPPRSPAPPDRRPQRTPRRGPGRWTAPRPFPPRARVCPHPSRDRRVSGRAPCGGRDWTCPRAGREVRLLSCQPQPMATPPTTTPNKEAPTSLAGTLDSSPRPAGQRDRAPAGRDPEWVGGVGSVAGSGSPAPPRSLRPRSGTQGLPPGDPRSRAGAAPRRRAASGGARGRTHRAELLGSVLHAPGSGCGAGCSPESPACAAAAPRLRSSSPAPPRPPGPRPSPQPGPAQRAPRPARSRPR